MESKFFIVALTTLPRLIVVCAFLLALLGILGARPTFARGLLALLISWTAAMLGAPFSAQPFSYVGSVGPYVLGAVALVLGLCLLPDVVARALPQLLRVDRRMLVSSAVVVAAILGAAWLFRYQTTATERGVAYVLDRWTGAMSYCAPSGCSPIPTK